MTKTNVQPIPSNSQHHDTPNNKTHVIKFRVTAEEKASLELTCKLLNLSLSTFIRRAIHNVKIEKTVIVAGGGEETLTAVSTLLAQCSKVGGNLNQLARHFNSGGADTEQIRAKLLDELADLTAFRLHAEKVLGATLKHIASKNSDYTAIEAYLVYQHDAFTGKQLLDEHGKPKLRDSYLLDTLECGDFSFATACLLANRKYGKNTQHGDIKSHQYIISFDPRDAADNGLTMEKAQALGLKFCSENFPGHPAIVCTHPDGHNHSGNIHVHIVIGSIRTREVERKPYMQKPRDWREGMKHSSTAQTMRHLRVEVMELCESAGLYQIDLLNGSKERVSEAEYWARRRGQMKLDRENAALTATGQQPRQKKFETVKDTLRKQIASVLYFATSFEDFSDRLLQQYGITVKESRGQLSYLPAGRTKFIRAKKLGDNYDKEIVLATLTANAEHKPKAQFKQDTIGKLIDIQSRMTEGKGIGYKRWLTKHNLKVMAQTVKLLQEKDLTDEDALNQRITELETKYHDSLAVVKDLEGRMKFNEELRYHVAAYASTKNIAQQLKTAKRPAAFEEQHRAELTAYRAAAAYFKANNIAKLPSPKKLEAEYAQLASEKAKFYEQYKETKEELLKLKTAKQNVASFFREEEPAQQER